MQRLDGVVQHYAWGHPDYLANLLGCSAAEPQAEYWLGAHPRGPATLADGRQLGDAVAADPQRILGPALLSEQTRFPYLLKILAAVKPLSLQCHPTKIQAENGFDLESSRGVPLDSPVRTYRDRNHKPELICALTPFEAKVGFRELARTVNLFEKLGSPGLLELAPIASGPKEESEAILNVLGHLLSLAPERAALLVSEVVRCADQASAWLSDDDRVIAQWAPKINDCFPGDIGVVISLMLNHVSLEPGEAIGFDAGNLHAYLSGVGVEIMANSDNVIRGGITPKNVDVAELLAVVQPNPSVPVIQSPSAAVHSYDSPADDFSLTRITTVSNARFQIGGPEIWLSTAGEFSLNDGETLLSLTPGQACFIPADNAPLTVNGRGQCWRAGVGGSPYP